MVRFSVVLAATVAAVLSSVVQAQPTVLTFDPPVTFDTYGDRAVNTPNVTLDFVTLRSGPPSLWFGGYADLSNALGHGAYDVPFRLDFTPDPGYLVTLNGFNIATWSAGSYDTDIRVWDENGSFDAPNLYSASTLLLPRISYAIGLNRTGSGVLSLYVSNLGSTGLDNLTFSQSLVPEPGSLALMGLGVVGLCAAVRSRRAGERV